MFVVYSIK